MVELNEKIVTEIFFKVINPTLFPLQYKGTTQQEGRV